MKGVPPHGGCHEYNIFQCWSRYGIENRSGVRRGIQPETSSHFADADRNVCIADFAGLGRISCVGNRPSVRRSVRNQGFLGIQDGDRRASSPERGAVGRYWLSSLTAQSAIRTTMGRSGSIRVRAMTAPSRIAACRKPAATIACSMLDSSVDESGAKNCPDHALLFPA
jgi:hypothetical protein